MQTNFFRIVDSSDCLKSEQFGTVAYLEKQYRAGTCKLYRQSPEKADRFLGGRHGLVRPMRERSDFHARLSCS